jgi:ATP-grasp domain, R2K clade family 2
MSGMNVNDTSSGEDTVPLLVLPPRYTEDTNALRKAAIDRGWDVERLPSWRAPEWLREREVVLYGEPLFAAVVADSLDVALIEPPFSWLADLPADLTKRKITFATLGEARRLASSRFVKPADDKCFIAKVYESGADLPLPDGVEESTPVLISEPVSWELEFRCFVLDREVRTLSPYLRDGDLVKDEQGRWQASDAEWQEAEAYAREVLADQRVELPPAVVVDVGIIKDKGWAVLEANAAWGSGIYGCDSQRVLETVARCSLPKSEVPEADARWVPKRG